MKLLSFLIIFSNGRWEVMPNAYRTVSAAMADRASIHEDYLQEAAEAPLPLIVPALSHFLSIQQAREAVRLMNRGSNFSDACREAWAQPDGSPIYAGMPDGVVLMNNRRITKMNSYAGAMEVAGMLRAYKVKDELGWEKLPQTFRNFYLLNHSGSVPMPHFGEVV
jgi:hypothetical protein